MLDIFVSVVVVADDRSEKLAKRVSDLAALLNKNYTNYEIVIVDNEIAYKELEKLTNLLGEVACLRIIRLSKLSDTDTAIFSGIEASIGDHLCVVYNNDPIKKIPTIIDELRDGKDIIFGVATNLQRQTFTENIGSKLFYWYNRKFLKIDIPHNSTYFIGMNRSVVNALTRSGRYSKHIRYLAKQIGFKSDNYYYELPASGRKYTAPRRSLILRAISLVSSYSAHPLRSLTYFGITAGVLNLVYAGYVVIINISSNDIAKGWTTLSLQASIMFFCLFIIIALLAEHIGQILEEVRQESPYHIMEELSSNISIADEERRNITK